MTQWDPTLYQTFAGERGRPFADLLARVEITPNSVVDLGCGPGPLTAGLATRWPEAEVIGVDSSAAMIASAEPWTRPGLRFVQADLATWVPPHPMDLVVSNAALQWIPGHRRLLPRLVEMLSDVGVLAFQVPGNFGEPSHQLLHELAGDPRFAEWTTGLERPGSEAPGDYLGDLAGLGCQADVWETTYLHVLPGDDPVFTWISGTGARPVLHALPEDRRVEFVAEYKALLRGAYPRQPYGTVLPFRRIFVVARRN